MFRNGDGDLLLLPLARIPFRTDTRWLFLVRFVTLSPASFTTNTVIGASRGSWPGNVGFTDREFSLDIVVIWLACKPRWTGCLGAKHADCVCRFVMFFFFICWERTNSPVGLARGIPSCWTRLAAGVENNGWVRPDRYAWRSPYRRSGLLARIVCLVIDDSGGACVGLDGGYRPQIIFGDRARLAIVIHNCCWYRNQDKPGDGLPAGLLVAARRIVMIAMAHAWRSTRTDVNDGNGRSGRLG